MVESSPLPLPGQDRRAEDKYLAAVNLQFNQLRGDVSEIKTSMKDVAQALTKLALVEERQAQSSAAMERAFATISKVDTKVDAVVNRVTQLEKNELNQARIAQWVDRAVWGAVGLLAMYAAAKIGLAG